MSTYIKILLLALLVSIRVSASNQTCTAPTCNVTAMTYGTGMVSGDTLKVGTGTYTIWNTKHLNGIVIINVGQVYIVVQGGVGDNTNTKMTGTGAGATFASTSPGPMNGIICGFVFTGSTGGIQATGTSNGETIDHCAVIDSSNPFYDNQTNQTTYDTTNNLNKRCVNCHFLDIYIRNSGIMIPNLRNANINILDSCELGVFQVDSFSQTVLVAHGSDWYIHDGSINQNGLVVPPQGDHGRFEIEYGHWAGLPTITRVAETGNIPGWFGRENAGYCLNHPGDLIITNCSKNGSQIYGFWDTRIDTISLTPASNVHYRGGNVYVFGCTAINMYQFSYQNWNTFMVMTYGMQGPTGVGFIYFIHAHGNLRAHCLNYNIWANSQSYGFSGGWGSIGWDTAGTDNIYYADPVAAGAITDTFTLHIAATSPLYHAGTTATLSAPYLGGTTDFLGNSRPFPGQTVPSIGAFEFIVPPCGSCFPGFKYSKKHS